MRPIKNRRREAKAPPMARRLRCIRARRCRRTHPRRGYPPYGTMPGSYPNPPQGQTPYGATPPQNPSAPYPPYGAAPAQNPDASGPHAPYGVNAPGYPGAAPQAPAPWEHPSEPAAAHPADPGTRDIFQAPPHDVASAGAPEAGPKAPDLTKHPQPAPTGSASAGAGRWKTKPIGRTIRHRRIPVQTKPPPTPTAL